MCSELSVTGKLGRAEGGVLGEEDREGRGVGLQVVMRGKLFRGSILRHFEASPMLKLVTRIMSDGGRAGRSSPYPTGGGGLPCSRKNLLWFRSTALHTEMKCFVPPTNTSRGGTQHGSPQDATQKNKKKAKRHTPPK